MTPNNVEVGMMSDTLHLTLKKHWYDMIESLEKRHEYRDIKPYWTKRLESKKFQFVQFKNGYSKTARTMKFRFDDLFIGFGITKWGAPEDKAVYILELGDRVK